MLCAMPATHTPSALRTALKSIAIFEALKGFAALLGLLGLLSLCTTICTASRWS